MQTNRVNVLGKRKKSGYSKGEINKMIDSLIHPLFGRNPAFVLVDSLLHGLVEQNPPETVVKFIRYNLPEVIQEIRRHSKQ